MITSFTNQGGSSEINEPVQPPFVTGETVVELGLIMVVPIAGGDNAQDDPHCVRGPRTWVAIVGLLASRHESRIRSGFDNERNHFGRSHRFGFVEVVAQWRQTTHGGQTGVSQSSRGHRSGLGDGETKLSMGRRADEEIPAETSRSGKTKHFYFIFIHLFHLLLFISFSRRLRCFGWKEPQAL